MNRFLEYTQALALDSFLQVLTFEERLQTSQYRAGRTNEVPAVYKNYKRGWNRTVGVPPSLNMTKSDTCFGWTSKGSGNQ